MLISIPHLFLKVAAAALQLVNKCVTWEQCAWHGSDMPAFEYNSVSSGRTQWLIWEGMSHPG